MLSTICFSVAGGVSSASQWALMLLQALLFTAVIVGGVVVAVACWAIIQQLIVGGALIALFGLVTFPRRKGGN